VDTQSRTKIVAHDEEDVGFRGGAEAWTDEEEGKHLSTWGRFYHHLDKGAASARIGNEFTQFPAPD
jgi:hypothetical protein